MRCQSLRLLLSQTPPKPAGVLSGSSILESEINSLPAANTQSSEQEAPPSSDQQVRNENEQLKKDLERSLANAKSAKSLNERLQRDV
jgi:hypothetical protein